MLLDIRDCNSTGLFFPQEFVFTFEGGYGHITCESSVLYRNFGILQPAEMQAAPLFELECLIRLCALCVIQIIWRPSQGRAIKRAGGVRSKMGLLGV
jgi:hypothetical protein